MSASPFDYFVSYKSEDVNLVRNIVDCLIANNLRVWFAEYEIAFTNYDNFKAEILNGIHNSKSALIFHNERWAESEHCKFEIVEILKRDINIINIEVPFFKNEQSTAFDIYTDLKSYPNIIYDYNPSTIIELIGKYSSKNLKHESLITQEKIKQSKSYTHSGFIQLNLGSLTPVSHLSSGSNELEENTFLLKKEAPEYTLSAKISFVPVTPYRSLSIIERGKTQERYIFDAYRNYYASRVLEEKKSVLGLNLFFYRGKGHLSFVALEEKNNDKLTFSKKYIISVPNYDNNKRGEILVVFTLEIKRQEGIPLMEHFCPFGPELDSIVHTIQYLPGIRKHYSIRKKHSMVRGMPDINLQDLNLVKNVSFDLPFVISYIITKETGSAQLVQRGISLGMVVSPAIMLVDITMGLFTLGISGAGHFLMKNSTSLDSSIGSLEKQVNLAPTHENFMKIARHWHNKGSYGQVAYLSRAFLWTVKAYATLKSNDLLFYLGSYAGDLARAYSMVRVELFSRDLTLRTYNIALEALYQYAQNERRIRSTDTAISIFYYLRRERDLLMKAV